MEKNHTDKNDKQYSIGPSESELSKYPRRHVYSKKKDGVGWRLLSVHTQEFRTHVLFCAFSHRIFSDTHLFVISVVFSNGGKYEISVEDKDMQNPIRKLSDI